MTGISGAESLEKADNEDGYLNCDQKCNTAIAEPVNELVVSGRFTAPRMAQAKIDADQSNGEKNIGDVVEELCAK